MQSVELAGTPALRASVSGLRPHIFFLKYAPPNDRQRFYLVENLLSRSKAAVKAESSCNWSSLGQGRNLLPEIEGKGIIVFGRKAFVKVENLAIGRIGRHSGPAGLR